MFVEALKRQNPALISAALSLWQQGKIAPDSWVIDVDQVLENGKRLIETARLYGIELYLMTKQFGRNPWLAEKLLALLNGGAVPEVKSAVIANAQSKVLIVEFHQPIAARVLEEAQKRGALPYPVGAESKYEIPPLFYRLSGTFRQANPQSEHCAIRINPNRSGEETVLRILRESIASI